MWTESPKMVTAAQGGQDRRLKSPFLTKKGRPRLLIWEKTSTIHPSSLGDRSSSPLKQSSTLEPEKSTCTSPLRRRRNYNQRRQIIKDGWADYEGEVVRSKDIQLEQNCPKETVAPSQVWRENKVIHEEEAPLEPPTTPSSES